MQRCGCGEEDCDADRLWADFETCATSVARLYREPTWKVVQVAAAATTQLYKNGIEIHRKAFDKGFEAGRRAAVKELVNAYGGSLTSTD
ncbi:unnamed protein product, partial [Mesorhabditis belari]|uniref:Uncharacterized protein n=1 Tax=Mesorhabditis belari TaxID=2138241 RepID=A0AAF3FE24_9BILA